MGGGSKIVESGTHSELMEKKGVYYALVGNQRTKVSVRLWLQMLGQRRK